MGNWTGKNYETCVFIICVRNDGLIPVYGEELLSNVRNIHIYTVAIKSDIRWSSSRRKEFMMFFSVLEFCV